jgi:hypothetical protein
LPRCELAIIELYKRRKTEEKRRKKKKERKKKEEKAISKNELLGGIAQVVTGYPIDTQKPHTTFDLKVSLVAAIEDLIRNEGIFAFYKGMLSPILGVGN